MFEQLIRRMKSPRGQALIEFAFIAPLMFVLLFAIVDFGIAIDRRITLQHSVRESARYAAVHTNELDIKQRAVDQAQGIIELADVDVCYEDTDLDATFGEPGEDVKVSATFRWEFPIMREILGAFGVEPLFVDMTPWGTARLERSVSGAVGCPS